jgi:hypothetical protein
MRYLCAVDVHSFFATEFTASLSELVGSTKKKQRRDGYDNHLNEQAHILWDEKYHIFSSHKLHLSCLTFTKD